MAFQKYKITKISKKFNAVGGLQDLTAEILLTDSSSKTRKATVTIPNEEDRIAYQKGTPAEKAAIFTKYANRIARTTYKDWAREEGLTVADDVDIKKDADITTELGILEVTDISKAD